MDLDLAQLRALSATVAEGSLDAAAGRLHVTPSAVSQRLRALEAATGRILLVRSRPVRPTPSGEVLLRLARQVEALAAGAAAELDLTGDARPVVPIAVNADSLSTWFLPAVAPLVDRLQLDLRRADQDHTAQLLRDGQVMAAVTTAATPVPGCRSTLLGAMRYRLVAAPSFAERWFPAGPTLAALAAAPMLVFDRQDRLQHDYLARRGADPADLPVHYVPGSTDFLTAAILGLGWAMIPDLQSAGPRADGRLAVLDEDAVADVALHWQQWKLPSATLDRLTEAVQAMARERLRTDQE